MCGIFGLIQLQNISQEVINKSFSSLHHRGSDGYGSFDGSTLFFTKNSTEFTKELKKMNTNTLFIHSLHSLVGNVAQPLQGKRGILLANCEIYNWQQVAKKHHFDAKNDADLLLQLLDSYFSGKKNIDEKMITQLITQLEQELDGDYAFVYLVDDFVILSRDHVGVKPLCYFHDQNLFVVSSENKVIKSSIQKEGILFNPNELIMFNKQNNKITRLKKKSNFIIERKEYGHDGKEKLRSLLLQSVEKRIIELQELPKEKRKLGILFSGGVDSSTIALLTHQINKQKHLGIEIICYTAAFAEGNVRNAPDLIAAQKVALQLGFTLKAKIVSLAEIEKIIPFLIPIIEANDPIRVGVALPFYFSCQEALKDGCKVMLSGLGSEELFAGYQRHADVLHKNGYTAINKECLLGLQQIWERDLYRDDLLTMHFQQELRLPFLDKELISFALQIPAPMKIDTEQKKIILRQVAQEFGLSVEFSQRKKMAAQYGSNFDKALDKLARKYGILKGQYLQQNKFNDRSFI